MDLSLHKALLLACVIVPQISIAQLHIRVIDDQNHPISNVECKIQGKENSKIAYTDQSGECIDPETLATSSNPIFIELSHMGYVVIRDTLFSSGSFIYSFVRDHIHLREIVITGEYVPTNAMNSIRKTTIINAKKIEQMGSRSVGDALRQELNMNISTDNVMGRSVSMQGFSGQNVKILIDGVPLVGRLNGNIDLDQIPTNSVERIEIIKGPLSVQYGTDAMGGTINIITKTSSNSSLDISSFFESIGHYNAHSNLSIRKDRHTFNAHLGRNYFDGWSANDPFIDFPQSKPADSNRVQSFNPKLQHFIKGGYTYQNNRIKFSPYLNIFSEELTIRGYPRLPLLDSAFDEIFSTNRIQTGINLSTSLNNDGKLNILSSYNRYNRIKNTYLKDLTNLDSELAGASDLQDTLNMDLVNSRITYHTISGSKLNYEIGIDFNRESIHGKRISNSNRDLIDLGIFSTAEWVMTEHLVAKPGIRFTYNNQFGTSPVPSLSIKSELNKFLIRGTYARGFRSPTLKELHLDFVDINHNIQGNPDLVSERGNHFNSSISYHYNHSNYALQIAVNGFYNQLNNQIRLIPANFSNSFTYKNVGAFASKGAEVELNYMATHYKLNVSGGFIANKDDILEGLGLSGFNYIPQMTSSIELSPEKSKFSFSVFYKYSGANDAVFLNSESEFILYNNEDVHLLDASVHFTLLKDQFSITSGLKNILNQTNTNLLSSNSFSHPSNNRGSFLRNGISLFTSLKYHIIW